MEFQNVEIPGRSQAIFSEWSKLMPGLNVEYSMHFPIQAFMGAFRSCVPTLAEGLGLVNEITETHQYLRLRVHLDITNHFSGCCVV